MQQFADMIKLREPEVGNVIGFMDGLSLTTECTSERLTQNAYYSGYHCDTMVNNVLAFGADGKVFFCALNYPGSWNDGSVTAQFFPTSKIELAGTKFALIRDFLEAAMHMELWSVQCQEELLSVCILLFVHITFD